MIMECVDVSENDCHFHQTILDNVGLVWYVIGRLDIPPHLLDDVVSEGVLALVNAAKHYDPNHGVEFSTYAYTAIIRKIWKFINREVKHRSMLDKVKRMMKTAGLYDVELRDKIVREYNDMLMLVGEIGNEQMRAVIELRLQGKTIEEIAQQLGITVSCVGAILSRFRKLVSEKDI